MNQEYIKNLLKEYIDNFGGKLTYIAKKIQVSPSLLSQFKNDNIYLSDDKLLKLYKFLLVRIDFERSN